MSALNSTILYSIAGEENQLVASVVCGAAIVAAVAVYYALSPSNVEHEFPKLRGIQLYHAWKFFGRRYDFLRSNFERNPGKSFSFNVLHHKVIALAGEDARHAFFSDSHLDFSEGYAILMGAVRIPFLWETTCLLIVTILGNSRLPRSATLTQQPKRWTQTTFSTRS
jgi:hypothetical protein